MDTKYNGWTNYETWLVNLWLDNDGTSEMLRELAADTYETKDEFDSYQFGKTIREYVESMYADAGQLPESGLIADLINAAFSAVNWDEIASHYEDDLPEPDDETAMDQEVYAT